MAYPYRRRVREYRIIFSNGLELHRVYCRNMRNDERKAFEEYARDVLSKDSDKPITVTSIELV